VRVALWTAAPLLSHCECI